MGNRKLRRADTGLVVKVIVLWNTLYMDAASAQLRAEGQQVRDENIAHLSPLGFEHINTRGRYAFILPDTIARNELRPFRDSALASAEPRSQPLHRFFVPLLPKP